MSLQSPLPPMVRGLPLLGNALDFWRDPIALIRRGYQAHGPIFAIRLGRQPAAVLIGPRYHAFFFQETDGRLSMQEVYRFLIPMFGEHIFFAAGPKEYEEQRRMLLPAFQARKMAGYVQTMAKETRAWMDTLGDSGTFELIGAFERLTMYIAASALLGEAFRHRMGDLFWRLYRDLAAGIEFMLPPNLPLPRFIRRDRARRKLESIVRQVIAERRASQETHQDFLQTFLQATYSDGNPPPEEVVLSLVIGLVFAGHETTAGHASWGLVQLLQHPQYLARVQEEVKRLVPQDESIDLDTLRRLNHLEWALKETERTQPVARLLMRYNRQGYNLGGYHVPAGWLSVVSPAVAHRLPEVFADPDRYDPLRFAPPRQEDRQVPFSLIGFGGGRHKCLGMGFAYQEMKVICSLLLRRFELELAQPQVQAEYTSTTSRPRRPTLIRYRRRG